jgi:GNAT superfamily N-acetyltransferase
MAFNPAVGWAMIHSHRGLTHNLAVYVKPELRRQGQGTGLVDSLLADYIGPGCSFLPGIPGSREFFLHLFEKYSPDLVTSR